MRNLLASAALMVALPFGASAFTVDFTDGTIFNNAGITGGNTFTHTYANGLEVTLTAINGTLNFTNFDGAAADCAALSLICTKDGAGVGDDEVTGLITTGEALEVSFNNVLKDFTDLYFMDMFRTDRGFETAEVYAADGTTLLGSFDAVASPNTSGLQKDAFSAIAQTLIFKAPEKTGDDGTNDYALAAIDINVVPLPASALLLLGGLGGLAALRRRRQTA